MRLIARTGMFVALALCARLSLAQDASGSPSCSVEVRDALLMALQYGIADVPVDYAPER